METTLNERIGLFLKKKNIPSTEIALKLNLNKSTVSNWVTGHVQIPVKHMVILLNEYESLNARWLLTGKGSMDETMLIDERKGLESQNSEGLIEYLSRQLQEKELQNANLLKEIGRLEERLLNRKK